MIKKALIVISLVEKANEEVEREISEELSKDLPRFLGSRMLRRVW